MSCSVDLFQVMYEKKYFFLQFCFLNIVTGGTVDGAEHGTSFIVIRVKCYYDVCTVHEVEII